MNRFSIKCAMTLNSLFDVETMEEKSKFITFRLYLITFAINIVSFTSGVCLGWTSPYFPKLKGPLNTEENPLSQPLTPTDESWISSLLGCGSIFSPIVFGSLADYIGRRNTLIWGAVPLCLSFLIIAFSTNVYQFCIARLLAGFGAGSGFTVISLYVGELAEDSIRGGLGCVLSISVAIGFLFIVSIGPYVSIQTCCLICSVPPAAFMAIMIFFVPKSPYFLVSQNKFHEAEESLRTLRGKNNNETIKNELASIKTFVMESSANKMAWSDMLATKGLRLGLSLTVGMIIFQQLSGINAVMSFLQNIFDSADTSLAPEQSAIVIGCVQVLSNIITPTIIDRLGRRKLYLTSAVLCAASEFSLGTYFFFKSNGYYVSHLSWLPIISLIIFNVGIYFGIGPMAFILIGEIFPNDMKSKASMITNSVGATCSFLITLAFPQFVIYIGIAQVFWMFSGCCALAFVYVFLLLPETKGNSFAEIQTKFNEK